MFRVYVRYKKGEEYVEEPVSPTRGIAYDFRTMEDAQKYIDTQMQEARNWRRPFYIKEI